ncbi:hypothetical protein [Coralloluteibacterium stylophorae]|uniref:Uncharacterized protein n=1 Tax=Coralloluteibacterium stylophorae TaxID=1776034 RepID=A0A8J7VU27_9GAMM|nr:hypothetical protein [Coralloluteibacterium stylophorae]MBS7457209.1 hypothetical protein [Coralloluteibacterium stylophorae]
MAAAPAPPQCDEGAERRRLVGVLLAGVGERLRLVVRCLDNADLARARGVLRVARDLLDGVRLSLLDAEPGFASGVDALHRRFGDPAQFDALTPSELRALATTLGAGIDALVVRCSAPAQMDPVA